MRLNHESYSQYLSSINGELINHRFFTPVLLNEETLVFPSMDEPKKSLIISLNRTSPLVYTYKDDSFFSSFENSFVQKFRKEVGKFEVKSIVLNPRDFIVEISIYCFEDIEKNLILSVELLPNCPNLFVLDGNRKIIQHYFKNKNRTIDVNTTYVLPTPLQTLNDGAMITNDLIKNHHENEYLIRRKEKYSAFTKFINSKINSLIRKIENINRDVLKAKENLKFEEYGDLIFVNYSSELKSHKSALELNGALLEIDQSKTVLENAQHFYKIARKSKETIDKSIANIENANKDLDEYRKILSTFENSNEAKADEIVAMYGQVKKKKEIKETIFNRPWKLNLNGTIIYFGRNASQNDFLSFVMKLDREFTWLHIKDKSGAHLVIANKNPTEEELLTACEISLLCSRATSGEIVYTKKKNVRRGHVLGEAILKNHSTIKLNNIRKETIEFLAKAKRCV